jgi:hypothetical protein
MGVRNDKQILRVSRYPLVSIHTVPSVDITVLNGASCVDGAYGVR